MTLSTKRICRTIKLAFEWHGGGGSALYQFASTYKIHGEGHRRKIYDEIDETLKPKDNGWNPTKKNIAELEYIRSTVKALPVDWELVSDEVYCRYAK